MPPRKGLGRGIVKSGNAGNAVKPSPPHVAAPVKMEDKPLFPPGSKYPLSLLNERCQKNGWEKPEVITRHHPDGHHFLVVIRRQNKKTSQLDSVQLEPHPPFLMPSALEARHWGATYALYRICNNIQLNRILPPGPREYWAQLEREHKASPEHLKWMYSPDPFSALKEVEARQDASSKRREMGSSNSGKDNNGTVGIDVVGAIEVKMSGDLRELVENAVKKAYDSRQLAGQSLPVSTTLATESHDAISVSLKHLLFTPPQIARTLKALSTPSPLTTSLLATSPTPLDAAISHLLLCVPECDLPPRFLARGAGESFVQSAHKGTEDLNSRWLVERAVKEAGYPETVVRSVLLPAAVSGTVSPLMMDWATLLANLGEKLIGEDTMGETLGSDFDAEERDVQRASEFAALESVYPSATLVDSNSQTPTPSADIPKHVAYLNIPIPNSPLTLHMVLPAWHPYPLSTRPPPMYVSSNSIAVSSGTSSATVVPPYVRLHLLAAILASPIVKGRDNGEGIGLIAVGIIEEGWEKIHAQGGPDVADVLRHLVQPPSASFDPPLEPGRAHQSISNQGKRRQRGLTAHVSDDRTDAQIRVDFEVTQKREQYRSLLGDRMKLPAWKAKSEFLQAFKTNRVVVCVGETGSGKTTQIPQYILDDYLATSTAPDVASLSQLQIIVTQPRRVAALSVASRVSAERGDDGSVGYTIRGDSNASRRTKLLFCTTGVVLRRLTVGNGLEGVRVVVVDEVHERSVDSDFLLLELRELLKKDKSLKVVLMSATINQKTFVDYFRGAALVTIPGRTFPVQDSYLEDIIPRISYTPSFTRPAQKQSEDQLISFRQMYESQGLDATSVRALEVVTRAERIDYQLVASIVTFIITNKGPGAILIFMPGVQEIKQCIEYLRSSPRLGPTEIFPLHANLSSTEQKAVFRSTTRRKIVVSTNVAETSITIDDVVYVIDTGKVKETSYDPESGLSRLTETWVTQAAGRQRRGRAGRTSPGECFKLYTKKWEEDMGKFPVPEILRVPLESLSLAVKAVREDEDVKLFLGKAIDPPQIAAMEKAWSVLQELGAVHENGKLTALGRHMSMLPVDLRLGKMLILASIFGCLDPVLTVAACLSCKPLFLSPVDKREEATRARMKFLTANSDLLTDAHAYDACMKTLAHGKTQALRDFCDENFISHTTVRDISSLREDLSSALLSAGLISRNPTGTGAAGIPSSALLKSIIGAGLYPRIARVTLPSSAVKFDKVQAGTVQRPQEAKEFKIFDLEPLDARSHAYGSSPGPNSTPSPMRGQRVFLHPSSVLFAQDRWKEPFLCYFRKTVTTKAFLRDATEVPLFAILLFGGPISINHVSGGLSVAGPGDSVRVRMKAWPRIGVLVNQLRQLLDEQLGEALEGSLDAFGSGHPNPVLEAMLAMVTRGGATG